MRVSKVMTKFLSTILSVALLAVCLPSSGLAQDQGAPPPSFSPDQLDRLVSRIALYPDPLLAQVLAAATFPDQISDAAKWADEHHYLRGAELANAINEDHLPWDPSVQAVLPFPSVLDMMASDMNWTTDLGNAFLAQRQDVMDAVQRMRQKARDFGYLRSNGQIVVSGGPYIEIAPANPEFIPVPYYDPLVVYARPRPGFVVGGAIGFGFGVSIGTFFRPWGWGYSRFDWRGHGVFINDRPWGRVWVNRGGYVHEYRGVQRWDSGRRVEGHELVRRNEHERNAWREGRPHQEEHEHGREHRP
jgi:Protein of unknown function (DUF3300)